MTADTAWIDEVFADLERTGPSRCTSGSPHGSSPRSATAASPPATS
ncbi:hypothetical protein [Microbacterium sp. NIBRBAC000506063]|nr:hypothetical protein [Microbacterium sp. NIBRBAC000506063]